MLKLENEGHSNAEMLFKDRKIEVHTKQEFIVIFFENRIQLDIFEELKVDLLYNLRKNLSNPDLKITVKLEKQNNEAKRLYTDNDKLNFLIENKPIVKELRERLGLDVNF